MGRGAVVALVVMGALLLPVVGMPQAVAQPSGALSEGQMAAIRGTAVSAGSPHLGDPCTSLEMGCVWSSLAYVWRWGKSSHLTCGDPPTYQKCKQATCTCYHFYTCDGVACDTFHCDTETAHASGSTVTKVVAWDPPPADQSVECPVGNSGLPQG